MWKVVTAVSASKRLANRTQGNVMISDKSLGNSFSTV
jgi:hypothetical protein